MKLTIRPSRLMIAAAVISGTALLMPAAALAAPAKSMTPARPTAPAARRCTSGQTVVWIGLPGSGAAGSTFYPLEFSNVSHRTCLLFGYPGVSAVNGRGHRIGPAASHSGRRRLVTLHPGATAHALLRIVDAGIIGGCHVRTAVGLRVFPPGQFRAASVSGFSFHACSNRRVLSVGPVRRGVGIP